MPAAEIPVNAVALATSFLQDTSNAAYIFQHVTALVLPQLLREGKGQKTVVRRPSTLMVVFAVALLGAAPFLSDYTPVLQVGNGSVGVLPLGTDRAIVTETPFYGIPVPGWSTNTTFAKFYNSIYVGAHAEHEDVIAHTFLFFATLTVIVLDRRLLVPWCLSLGVGALITRPLMLVAVHHGWLEGTISALVAFFFAARYKVLQTWIFVFSAWVYLDAASHWYYGHNFDYAMWTGKYALSWGLYGQAMLAVDHAQHFVSSLL